MLVCDGGFSLSLTVTLVIIANIYELKKGFAECWCVMVDFPCLTATLVIIANIYMN